MAGCVVPYQLEICTMINIIFKWSGWNWLRIKETLEFFSMYSHCICHPPYITKSNEVENKFHIKHFECLRKLG